MIDEIVRKVGQSLADKMGGHMMRTGHTRISLPVIKPIDIIEGKKFKFVQYCEDCKEESFR